jgi:hypothetical protein
MDRFYLITVKGHLDDCWSAWFDGLAVSRDEADNTTPSGLIPDQAPLHGVLARIRDTGLTLLAIICDPQP